MNNKFKTTWQNNKIGLYAENEKWMFKFQAFKDRLLGTFAQYLHSKDIHPNTLSIIGALAAVLVPVSIEIGVILPVLLIIIHLLLDGIDGILARTCGLKSVSGSIIDSVCDHIGIIFISLAISIAFPDYRLITIIFVIAYTLLVLLAYAMSFLKSPFKYIIRPRLYVYIAFMADLLFGGRTAFAVLTVSAILLAIQVILGIAAVMNIIGSELFARKEILIHLPDYLNIFSDKKQA